MHIYTSVCTPMSIVTCPSCASVLRNRRKAESLAYSTLQCIEFHIEGCLCSLAFNTISVFCLAEQRKGRHKFMEDTFNKTQKPSVWSKIARPLLCDTFGMWHEESPLEIPIVTARVFKNIVCLTLGEEWEFIYFHI